MKALENRTIFSSNFDVRTYVFYICSYTLRSRLIRSFAPNFFFFLFSLQHGKKFKEHKDRLRSIRGVIDMKPPSSISTRCTSPSKLIIAKNGTFINQ